MSSWAGSRYKEFKWKVLEKYGAADGVVKCALCSDPIDLTLPGTVNAGFTIDHIFPKEFFPDLILQTSNHQPAHSICNKRKGLKSMMQVEAEYLAGNSTERIF